MSNKGKSNKKGLFVSCLIVLLAIVGFCMVFLPLLSSSDGVKIGGFAQSATVTFPGLGVIFGGDHDVTVATAGSLGSSSTTTSMSFAFNTMGMLAFVLPLAGAVCCFLNMLVKGKLPILDFVGVALEIVGFVFLFLVPSQFNAVNETSYTLTYGVGLIIALVAYGLSMLASAYKLVALDLHK